MEDIISNSNAGFGNDGQGGFDVGFGDEMGMLDDMGTPLRLTP